MISLYHLSRELLMLHQFKLLSRQYSFMQTHLHMPLVIYNVFYMFFP